MVTLTHQTVNERLKTGVTHFLNKKKLRRLVPSNSWRQTGDKNKSSLLSSSSSLVACELDCYLQLPARCNLTAICNFLLGASDLTHFCTQGRYAVITIKQIRGLFPVCVHFQPTNHYSMTIPVVARYKAWVYVRSLAGIVS